MNSVAANTKRLEEAQRVLREVFGFSEFRSVQGAIIERVLSGGHTLVMMPTGGGKSLCYQVPAIVDRRLAGDRNGLTLVLSPLVALMKDQVDGLRRLGVDVGLINSSLDRGQREAAYRDLANGAWDLLYVTPERFRKDEFREAMSRRRVSLLAIDEAHCISEWGHDFRPDYTRMNEFRQWLGCPTTLALTATATPDVQADILKQLELSADEVATFHEGIDRPNLELQVSEVWGEDEKLAGILDACDVCGVGSGSVIVYFTLIKTLEQFSERLRQKGVEHLVYHGDLSRDQRRSVQQRFMESDSLVLATNAFGMGIDKEDIRGVIHAEVPGSLEAYMQEIGRSGRDGERAVCRLLYDERDLTTQMRFIQWANPDRVFYENVFHFLETEQERLAAFGLDWLRDRIHPKHEHDHRLETVLAMLDRWGVTEGETTPWGLGVTGPLPAELVDDERLAMKLKRDQQKLYAIVEYVRFEGDRHEFLRRYFGLSGAEAT